MARLPGIRRVLRLRDQRDASLADVDAELRFHLESRAEDLVARGMSPDAARAAALAQFGDWHHYRQHTLAVDQQRAREVRMRDVLDSIIADLAFAWRGLRRNPVFAITALFTLVLGLGATIAVFSAVSGVLLRGLPFRDAARIVHVGERDAASPNQRRGGTTSFENFDDWRRTSHSFESMGLYSTYAVTLTGHGEPQRVPVANVTSGMFEVFDVTPYVGRRFVAADNELNAPSLALLSYDYWRARFGADRGIVGQTVQLNFTAAVVVGVLPPGFHPPASLDRPLWLNFINNSNDGRAGRSKNVYARLAPGLSLDRAGSEMRDIARRLAAEYPKENADRTAIVAPAADLVIGDVRRPLLLLLGASALVLLIACANVSNLLLARGAARSRELAVRGALGADRPRIVRQLLTECVLLAAIGTAGGFALAYLCTHALVQLGPEVFRTRPPTIDGSVVLFSVGGTVIATLIFGLLPAMRLTRRDGVEQLRGGNGERVISGGGRLRGTLAVAQLSLAVVLLATGALIVKSFARLLRVEPGIRPDHLLTASVNLPRLRYDGTGSVAFYSGLRTRLEATPGVHAAALTSLVPFSGDFDRVGITHIGGRPELTGNDAPEGDRYVVSPDYFATMGIVLRRGRLLAEDDRYDTPVVCVVDEVFAKSVFGDNAIGQTMQLPLRAEFARVVGVVAHVKTYGLDADSPGQIYMSNAQYPWRWMSVVVRTTGEPVDFASTLSRVVHSLDRDEPVSDVASMDQLMENLLRGRRFTLLLLGGFGVAAIVLASIGLYGVIAYGVTQRRRELSVRVALGAEQRQVAAMIVRQGAMIGVLGAALGSAGALIAGRVASSLLFDVSPRDPMVLGGVTLLLIVVAMLASFAPAMRASRVSPADALRGE